LPEERTELAAPSLSAMREMQRRLSPFVVTTPLRRWDDEIVQRRLDPGTELFLKEELFQRSGTFKVRGALSAMLDLAPEALARGVTAVSAGNHALAVAYASRVLGTTAKVVMPKNASPARVRGCQDMGAVVELVDDVHAAFARVREIESGERRTFVHPFEGREIALGTSTVGLEVAAQIAEPDAVVIPIGGGGLCAGMAAAVKARVPECRIYGVEPAGADTMRRSFAAGSPQSIDTVRTIADSLGSPHAAPYSFALCRRYVDELVTVDDDEIRRALYLLFRSAKLAVEPAGAATTAAVLGPLRERLRDKRVVAVVCGANIDAAAFAECVQEGARLLGQP
jgi:threonine dehydratase